jgi:chitinase
MINRLRERFTENPSKKYLISGAPQCPLPEVNMGEMINAAKFDLLWIQFYNNDFRQCTARQWADNYALTGEEDFSMFSYDQWYVLTTILCQEKWEIVAWSDSLP